MRGKEKCKALKEIRRQIAEENDIPYVVSQCTHQGDCRGTCPKCEAELRYLERELAIRQGLGKAVAVVGISTSVCASLTACSPVAMVKDALGIGAQDTGGSTTLVQPEDIAGDIDIFPDDGQNETGESDNPDTAVSEEGSGVQGAEDSTAGTSPALEESEESRETEEMLMGEIMPTEEAMEETSSILEGDIALPEDWMNSEWSYESMEEQTP